MLLVNKIRKINKDHREGRAGAVKTGFRIFNAILLKIFVLIFWAVLLICLYGVIKFYRPVMNAQKEAKDVVSRSTEETFAPGQGTVIYDSKGEKIADLSEDSRKYKYLEYDQIPKDVRNAFIAVEDRTFWDNKGYDIKGMVRVGADYVRTKGQVKHGASTITQQLARTIFLTREVSLERKLKEIMIAKELTNKYSKKKIMEYYVNTACFGNNIYGIEQASLSYLGKHADELSLAETAYLCSIPNRPEYYQPWNDPDNAYPRQRKILSDMLECGYITESDYNNALSAKIKVKAKPKQKKKSSKLKDAVKDYQTSYATYCATKWLMKENGFSFRYKFRDMDDYSRYKKMYQNAYSRNRNELMNSTFYIKTSLNTNVQRSMQDSLDEVLSFDNEKKKKVYALQGSATAIDNKTGRVIAVIGGRAQEGQSSLNRAFQAYRQPGSTIKPVIVYAPSLEKGYTTKSRLKNISVSSAKYSHNVSSMGGEGVVMSQALQRSLNGCAYSLFNAITPNFGLYFTEQMEFDAITPADHTLSAALGGLTYGTNTVQMASAYRTLENNGKFASPTCIISIKDRAGNELYKKPKEKEVYNTKAAAETIKMMRGVLDKDWGTAHKLGWNSKKIQAAGKTGTTNGSKDGWFCGTTPYYTVSVWVGYDTPRTLSNLYGATYPASIWKKCMESLVKGKPDAKFDTEGLKGAYTVFRTDEEIAAQKRAEKQAEKLRKEQAYEQLVKDHTRTKSDRELINTVNNYIALLASGSSVSRNNYYNDGKYYANRIRNKGYRTAMLDELDTAKDKWDSYYYSMNNEMESKASSLISQEQSDIDQANASDTEKTETELRQKYQKIAEKKQKEIQEKRKKEAEDARRKEAEEQKKREQQQKENSNNSGQPDSDVETEDDSDYDSPDD